MGGQIEAFVDVVSPYSFFAFKHLLDKQSVLKSYGVTIKFCPIFLGGVNVASGNQPPWERPKAKLAHSDFDRRRAARYFGVKYVETPSWFPIHSILPQRALLHIQQTQPTERFESTFLSLYRALWEEPLDISKPENLAKVLARENYSESEVKASLEATKDAAIKKLLSDNTQRAVDLGAFGAPFMVVTNGKGEREPFFGSDRFYYIWEFLGLNFKAEELLENKESARL